MGRLAVRLCIGGGLVGAILQLSSLGFWVMQQGAVSPVGLLAGYPLINAYIGFTEMEIQVHKFAGLQDIGSMINNRKPAEWEVDSQIKKDKEEQAKLDSLPAEEREKARKDADARKNAIEQLRKKHQEAVKSDWKQYTCSDGRSLCIRISLSSLAALFSNNAAQLFSSLMPGFPGSHNTAQYFYYGGMISLIFNVLCALVMLLGCGYLYYYAEVKATKTARKAALISFIAGPVIAVLVFLLLTGTLIVASQNTNNNPWFYIVFAKGQIFPQAGYIICLFNMFFMFMLIVFSRFWRMKRAERVRKQRKDEEEEEEFMRLMGIDPNAAFESSDEEDEEEEEEEESDDEEAPSSTQRSSAFTPSDIHNRPQVVASQPVGAYGYTTTYTTQPQVVTYGAAPQQPNVQRIYL